MNAKQEVEIKEENVFWPFNSSTQAWDVDGASVYVTDASQVKVKKGGEESLFSVPLDSLEADVRSCKRGGNPDKSCNNHITNVQVCPDMEAQLAACGTNALQPEVFFLENATYSGKRHTQQLCPKSAEIDALVQVTSCGSDPSEIEGVAVHVERDSAKIITKSRIFDFKLWSPKFVHISSTELTEAPLFFFTESSSAGELASFVGVPCDSSSGVGSNLIKIPLKCSREDFVFAKMKQVVEITSGSDSTFHILFSTPFNLYKKTTICSYSLNEHILPVLKPALEKCDAQLSNVVIAETPILEDRGSESPSGPYTSISSLWENVLLLGTQEGELITAQRDTGEKKFLISETRKLTHGKKCAGAVLDLKSTVVDQVATVYAAFDTCIASVPITDCSSLDLNCCESRLFCKVADGRCVPSLDESALSYSGRCMTKEVRAQEDCPQMECPQNATIPVGIVGLIVMFVAFFGGYFWGKCSLKPQEYMDDSEWGITNTLSASSSSTAKTRTRIKTSPSKQSATLRSNRSDEGETARTIPVMGVSSIGSNRESTLSPRKSADGNTSTHESRA